MGMVEFYVATNLWPDPSVILQSPSKGQFRWCGSVAAIFLFVPLVNKILGIKHQNYLDVLAVALCILTAVTKQGCLFSGDGCYGIPTTLPWGMYFPYGPAPNLLPVHPTPLYDGIFHLLLFALLIVWDSKYKRFSGQTALFYFIAASSFFILIEIIRLNPRMSIGITVPQLTYGLILLIALWSYKVYKFKPL